MPASRRASPSGSASADICEPLAARLGCCQLSAQAPQHVGRSRHDDDGQGQRRPRHGLCGKITGRAGDRVRGMGGNLTARPLRFALPAVCYCRLGGALRAGRRGAAARRWLRHRPYRAVPQGARLRRSCRARPSSDMLTIAGSRGARLPSIETGRARRPVAVAGRVFPRLLLDRRVHHQPMRRRRGCTSCRASPVPAAMRSSRCATRCWTAAASAGSSPNWSSRRNGVQSRKARGSGPTPSPTPMRWSRCSYSK